VGVHPEISKKTISFVIIVKEKVGLTLGI